MKDRERKRMWQWWERRMVEPRITDRKGKMQIEHSLENPTLTDKFSSILPSAAKSCFLGRETIFLLVGPSMFT